MNVRTGLSGPSVDNSLRANGVQRTVKLEEFLNDGRFTEAVPRRRGVRNFLDDFDIQQNIDVRCDGLAGNAGVFGQFSFVEFPTWGKIQQPVDKERNALVSGEM